MKNWPPNIPDKREYLPAFGAVIESAQDLLKKEDLALEERKIVNAMRRNNTTVGLTEAAESRRKRQLAVLIEIRKNVHFNAFKLLSSVPVEHFFAVPTDIAHTAVNGLTKVEAITIADLLAHDFVLFAQEQHDSAEAVGAPEEELKTLDPRYFDAQLREIHKKIRTRTLAV